MAFADGDESSCIHRISSPMSTVVLRHFGHEEFSVIVLHCEVGEARTYRISSRDAEALRCSTLNLDIMYCCWMNIGQIIHHFR